MPHSPVARRMFAEWDSLPPPSRRFSERVQAQAEQRHPERPGRPADGRLPQGPGRTRRPLQRRRGRRRTGPPAHRRGGRRRRLESAAQPQDRRRQRAARSRPRRDGRPRPAQGSRRLNPARTGPGFPAAGAPPLQPFFPLIATRLQRRFPARFTPSQRPASDYFRRPAPATPGLSADFHPFPPVRSFWPPTPFAAFSGDGPEVGIDWRLGRADAVEFHRSGRAQPVRGAPRARLAAAGADRRFAGGLSVNLGAGMLRERGAR